LASALSPELVGRCLEMWQCLAYPKAVTGDLVRAWQVALARHDVAEDEFRESAQRLLDRREYPTPADALAEVVRIRYERSLLDPPCVEVLDSGGHVRLASRSAAAAMRTLPARVPSRSGDRVRDLVGPLAERFGNLMETRKPHGDH